MKRALNAAPNDEPSMEISPETDAAMRALKELFSDPKIRRTASFRCCTEGPTEFDVLFESVIIWRGHECLLSSGLVTAVISS
jgi:hypothetical protein